MAERSSSKAQTGRLSYAWVIVVAGCLSMTMNNGIMYSYGVFFKPLMADFDWSRAATSGVYSLFMLTTGFSAIGMGWLADRLGPRKVMLAGSLMSGLGLILTSQIRELWQIYVTYGLITATGLSGILAISFATTARWFTRKRGMALGIVSAGTGLGTLIMSPLSERLIENSGWSGAYMTLGVIAFIVLASCALLMRLPSKQEAPPTNPLHQKENPVAESSLHVAIRSKILWQIAFSYVLFNFCIQVVMVHLVNYATDMGINTLVAATFISVIGIGSITGRLIMGSASDRIGTNNALLLCCAALFITMVWLTFIQELWMFYVFAIVFGFSYGGEVPQMPALADRYFGLRAVAALVGVIQSGSHAGGALGSWAAGKIFDIMSNYQLAFTLASLIGFLGIIMAILLKRQKPTALKSTAALNTSLQ